MRKILASVAIVGAALLGTGTARAADGQVPFSVTVHTSFDGKSPFSDSTLDGCTRGYVLNGDFNVTGTPNGGNFSGEKVFSCKGGNGGFTVWLNASFDASGSTGTWTVTSSWGTFSGLRGQGKLVGTPTRQGIDDAYSGWMSL